MSKWIVQLDYEFGEFEPNSIYFRRVCSDDIEYSFAYDTKREALEAFCVGQMAMNEMRKEKEAIGKDDSKDELKISKLDVASQKIDLLLTFLEAVCRNLGNDIKKIK